jgi:V/A-type H+-transporting ATPase subunit B
MAIDVSLELNDALDLGWQTMAECFEPQELLIKKQLLDEYFHASPRAERQEVK